MSARRSRRAALGVGDAQRAMFIFYYAVLSEVTPPTALAAVAAAADTGGDVIRTMWQTWKYTLPAFCVPIAFVLTSNGAAQCRSARSGRPEQVFSQPPTESCSGSGTRVA